MGANGVGTGERRACGCLCSDICARDGCLKQRRRVRQRRNEGRAACVACDGTGRISHRLSGDEVTCMYCRGSGMEPVLSAPVAVQEVRPIGPRVIGLCGLAGSGKSTVAAILEREGYTRLRFGAGLKAMFRALLVEFDLSASERERMVEGDMKDVPAHILGGRSPRQVMQSLGQDWGRKMIDPDLWVRLTMRAADEILDQGGRVVIEDVRQPNEAAAVQGGEVKNSEGERELWMVFGRGGLEGEAGAHETEADPRRLLPDLMLGNSGSLADLRAVVLWALEA